MSADVLPYIDATHYYTTREAASLLRKSAGTLRRWRMNGQGPKYFQSSPNSPALYYGLWLIEFRRDCVKVTA